VRASTATRASPASSPIWPGSGTIVARITQSPVTPSVLLRNQTHSAPKFAQMKLRSEAIVASASRAIEGGPSWRNSIPTRNGPFTNTSSPSVTSWSTSFAPVRLTSNGRPSGAPGSLELPGSSQNWIETVCVDVAPPNSSETFSTRQGQAIVGTSRTAPISPAAKPPWKTAG
jgi:hypothetical protein